MVTGTAAPYTHEFFRTNHQGSIISMGADDGSRAEGPFTYDPYGNCFDGGNPCSAGEPYRFTGRRLDPETGLLYYRARYYDPGKGRFLQTDPVGYTADLNLYTYVGNDPTDKTDPSGMTCTGTGENLRCQADKLPSMAGMNLDQRAAFQSKVAAFNKCYTDTVKKLVAGKTSATFSLPKIGPGASGTVTGTISSSEVANALISRTVAVDPSRANPITDAKTNTTFIPMNVLEGRAGPQFGGAGRGERGSNVVLVHEGIHGTATEAELLSRTGATYHDLSSKSTLGSRHQESYDDAAEQLYGDGP